MKNTKRAHQRHDWASWPDEKLLDLRFCDLGLRLEGTWIEGPIAALRDDLDRRGIRFRPHVWLSEEWFSPEGVPGIAMPFYLAHPKLARLERRKMLEVEGGTPDECLRILRHECGHALSHAYQLHRLRRWQKLFGPSSRSYPDSYRPNPASRRFVQHLRLYYAQSHPDEDFAETFAVWLRPREQWRKRYAGWPALEKLEYVDELIEEIRRKPPLVRNRSRVESLSELRTTLREHYAEKLGKYRVGWSAAWDRELRSLFSDEARHAKRPLASAFLRRHRSEIRHLVARWTGAYQLTLDQVLTEMIGRCRELGLRAVGDERKLQVEFAVLLTAKTVHSLYSRASIAL